MFRRENDCSDIVSTITSAEDEFSCGLQKIKKKLKEKNQNLFEFSVQKKVQKKKNKWYSVHVIAKKK